MRIRPGTSRRVSAVQTSSMQVLELPNRGDARGLSFVVPDDALAFLNVVGNVHFAAAKPGAVRGNHYHLRRREATIVLPGSKWSLHWAENAKSEPQHREFDGNAAVLVLLWPQTVHAIRNDGSGELWLFAMQSEANDPSDTVTCKLV
jgi:oxalate decarboxylase/phosphoglucose isomerase-like protein (cupin superfamily)